MRRIVTVLAALLLLVPFASIDGSTVSSIDLNDGVLYVGGSGPNNYTSIGDAVMIASEGATIYVYLGYYHESIVLDKQLILIGIEENGERPVIYAIENESAVIVETDGCVLRGFIMESKGVLVNPEGSPSCEVRSDNNVIENNTFMYGRYSFYLNRSSHNIIKNNEITKGYWCGMRTDNGTDNTIINNIAKGNMGEGFGMWETGSRITENIATENLHGISFSDSTNCIVSSNHIYDNDQYGLDLFQCSDISIVNNSVHSHIYGGLQLTDSSNCAISGNEIHSNGAGVMIQSNYAQSVEQYHTVTRNNISSNGVGVYIESSIENTFSENNLIDNDNNAWFLEDTILGNPYSPLRPCYNVWNNNYWSDWSLLVPKPIKGYLDVTVLIFYFRLPWFMFDWHPAPEPYEW